LSGIQIFDPIWYFQNWYFSTLKSASDTECEKTQWALTEHLIVQYVFGLAMGQFSVLEHPHEQHVAELVTGMLKV
jgi:hypothetical protein